MSLDVSLYLDTPTIKSGTGVFVRENGANRELSVEEVKLKYPDSNIEEVEYKTDCVFSANITHNLNKMASEAGVYDACWRPYKLHKDYGRNDGVEDIEFEQKVVMYAKDIVPFLQKGYDELRLKPEFYKQFDSPSGWGVYDNFLPWVKNYLDACLENPDATISVSR